MVQLVSPTVRAFLEPATDESIPKSERRALMREAALYLSARLRDDKNAKGYMRLFTMLKEHWPADEPKPGIYSDPLQRRTEDSTVVTNLNHDSSENVTVSLDPDGLRLKYSILDDR
jgi:hypothetical protein